MNHQINLTNRELRLVAVALQKRLSEVARYEAEDKAISPTHHTGWTGERIALEDILRKF